MRTRHLILTALFFCPALWAQTPAATVSDNETPQTIEQASAMRERAKQMNKEADAVLESEQAECYKKFLVNSCLDEAKKRHLQTTLEARKIDAAGRDFQREAKRTESEAKEAKRATDFETRAAEQKAQGEAYREDEAARAAARQAKLAKKAQQAEAGRKKTAEEQAKRQAKEEKRAKKDAERAAKKAREAEKSASKAAGTAN